MRFEWIMYSSRNRGGALKCQAVMKNLPDCIRKELLQDERLLVYPSVEAHKKEIIQYFDRVFGIGKTRDIRKEHNLEIDKREIGRFTHFEIGPKTLEIDREFFVDLQKPTCESFYCYTGMKLLSAVRMNLRKAKSIGIAELGFGAFGKRVYLAISAELKDIFDAEGITGLEYEPIEVTDVDLSDKFRPPYMARIRNVIYQKADEVIPSDWACHKHRVIWAPVCVSLRFPLNAVSNADFVEMGGVIAKGQVYNYKVNQHFIVTRRVLELLLNNKIKGLTRMAFILKTKFIPIRFDEVTVF